MVKFYNQGFTSIHIFQTIHWYSPLLHSYTEVYSSGYPLIPLNKKEKKVLFHAWNLDDKFQQ